MRKNTVSAILQFTVSAIHMDTSRLTTKHSALQWCLSTVSRASSDVTTTTRYWSWKCVHCMSEMQSRDKVERHCWQTWNWDTDLSDPASIPYRGCRLHVTGGPWRIWQTFLRPTHWQLGRNVGTRNCRQVFSYMFEGFSGTWYGGSASSAIQQPEWFGNFFIPFCSVCTRPKNCLAKYHSDCYTISTWLAVTYNWLALCSWTFTVVFFQKKINNTMYFWYYCYIKCNFCINFLNS